MPRARYRGHLCRCAAGRSGRVDSHSPTAVPWSVSSATALNSVFQSCRRWRPRSGRCSPARDGFRGQDQGSVRPRDRSPSSCSGTCSRISTGPIYELLSDPQFRGSAGSAEARHAAAQAPVLINSNRFDPLVPYGPAAQLGRDWCAEGSDVEFRTNEQPPLLNKVAINHALPMLVDGEPAMRWIADRLQRGADRCRAPVSSRIRRGTRSTTAWSYPRHQLHVGRGGDMSEDVAAMGWQARWHCTDRAGSPKRWALSNT